LVQTAQAQRVIGVPAVKGPQGNGGGQTVAAVKGIFQRLLQVLC
jgi:hypothetical protein